MPDVVLFVPGFFGFGEFGNAQRPLIEYFARVEDALLQARRDLRFEVHTPPPARGGLREGGGKLCPPKTTPRAAGERAARARRRPLQRRRRRAPGDERA